ncbi:MAG: hypothetical protein AAGB97_06770 [Dehalococcoidia bacterium]|nr:hypothetical protein [Chloroflexota bacterium]
MDKIDFDSFMAFCKRMEGQKLPTAGGRAEFTLESVQNEKLFFVPRSGKPRHHQKRYIESVLDHHARTGSLSPSDYRDVTRNASYILALVKRYVLKSSPYLNP